MTKEKIERINALYKKSKAEGLTPAEAEEQQRLRKEYIEDFRRSTLAQLEKIDIQNPDGSIEPLVKKQ